MEENKANRNRTFSFFCIGIFAASMVLLVVIGINIVSKILYHQELIAQQERMEEELDYLGDIGAYTKEGYYIVYSDGRGYALDSDGKVIVIYEMK